MGKAVSDDENLSKSKNFAVREEKDNKRPQSTQYKENTTTATSNKEINDDARKQLQ